MSASNREEPAPRCPRTVFLRNTGGEIAGLTISDPPNQAEVHALRNACEELADEFERSRRSVTRCGGRLLRWGG